MKKSAIFILIIIIILSVTACGEHNKKSSGGDLSTQEVTEIDKPNLPNEKDNKLMTPVADKFAISHDNYPRIDGSTSTLLIAGAINRAMYQNANNENYPQEASKTVPSYKLLIKGDVDMILVPYASSDILKEAEERGVGLEFHPIAAEALVFITPIENKSRNISGEEIREIYLKNGIGNWSKLGGPDKKLVPICRNADSGSQSQMDNLILKGEKMHPKINKNHVELTMEGMLEQVAFYHSGGLNSKPTNSYALGYTLYTYLRGMGKMTGIDEHLKLLAFEGVMPTEESISNGSYPLADFYYAVIRKDLGRDHSARSIIKWLVSDEGRDAIRGVNLIPKE